MGLTLAPEKINSRFWLGKRVLLVGHTGFKGSWLSLWLQSMGACLSGIALNPPMKPALFECARVAEGMEHRILDIRDFASVKGHLDEFQPEIIIHMAAQPLVRYSYKEPVETYAVNVMGTVHVLEAARKASSVKVVINVTTDKCYENHEWVWGYRENDPMGGHDPYSSSKGCSELVTSAYRSSFFDQDGIALASVRAGNVIGGGDWAADRLIPDILRALEAKIPVVIRSPNAIRPWQHVLEPLSGYLMLAQALYEEGKKFSSSWNFGPNDEDAKPVQWIVEQMTSRWGGGATWIQDTGDNPHEANYLKLDISKAKGELGWKPVWDLDLALQKIIDWHKAWLSGVDVRSVTLQQIDAYTRYSE
ncbi:CDP-glucose 4,6-dehydratase [Rhodobacterales bacterium HKCCA1058]|nr:CDP-glucose 4,6-dehydratase [Rhodobacterales bacterium HKCCA1058]